MQLAEAFAEEHKGLGHSAKSYTDKVMLAHCATVVSAWLAALLGNGGGLGQQLRCMMTYMCRASISSTIYATQTCNYVALPSGSLLRSA